MTRFPWSKHSLFHSQNSNVERNSANIAGSKESDQDGDGIENQVHKDQLKELVMISLSKAILGGGRVR